MTEIRSRIEGVRQRIRQAAAECRREAADIRLVAVSKTRSPAEIRQAVSAGLTDFGENYLQEALPKIEALRESGICWHFIGPVQSNKTRELAAQFDWVQTVDRVRIAQRLNDQRGNQGKPLNICVQVNISREPQKAGVTPEQAPELCRLIMDMPRLRLRGLMAIPAAGDTQALRSSFESMCELYRQLQSQGLPLDTLSMGMSTDLESAVSAGSNMLRIGTDIFGPRN